MAFSRSWVVSQKTFVLSLWLTMRWRLFPASFFQPSLIWEVQHNTHLFISLTCQSFSLTAFDVSCWHWILKYLAELDLQGNVLTKLPDIVAEMEHLTSISLANNSFSIFPDKLTEIATLERINLEGNRITGNIPRWKHEYLIYKGGKKSSFVNVFVFSSQKSLWISCLRCQHLRGWMSGPILWTQILCLLCSPLINLTYWPHSHRIHHILYTCTYWWYAMCLYVLWMILCAWVIRNSNSSTLENDPETPACAINLNFFSNHIFVWIDMCNWLFIIFGKCCETWFF